MQQKKKKKERKKEKKNEGSKQVCGLNLSLQHELNCHKVRGHPTVPSHQFIAGQDQPWGGKLSAPFPGAASPVGQEHS
jgi:hypothetical protein